MNNKENSWYKKQIVAQNAKLNDLVDWTDDDTVNNAIDVMGPQVVDFDELEMQRAQATPLEQGESSVILEEEIGDYLADDLIEQDEQSVLEEQQEEQVEEGYFDGSYIPSKDELEELGIETIVDTGEEAADTKDKIEDPELFPDFHGDHRAALSWAKENNRVAKLSYLTLGKKRGRGGKEYLKREMTDDRIPGTGVNIWRIVEPHDIFRAQNGHDILVTYDRSVRHIRAFRLENVTNVEFTKKRGTDEPSYFNPGVRKIIIKGNDGQDSSTKIQGIEAMNANIFQNLKSIGDNLEEQGMSKTAAVITSTMSNLLNIKTAQYVGPQGYWIRQKRCWDNCYRNKRTTSPEKAAQVVWTECWEEYNKSINDNKSGWEKYAQEDTDLFKYANGSEKEWCEKANEKFAKEVEKKVASGENQGTAIYLTLEQNKDEYSNMILADADNLSKIAEKLKESGQEELSEKIANISIELLKEAQFGGGFEGALNKMRKYNPFSGKSRAKGRSGDIITRIKRITQQALQMANQFNTIKQQARQSGQQAVGQEQSYNAQQQQQQDAQAKRQQTMQNVKAMPGQAYNWLKDKGSQIINNPSVQQGAQALGGNDVDIKTAAPNTNPTFQSGVEQFGNQLREEFQTFMENIRKEGTAMGQMAAKSTDPSSQQRASQVAQRMMQFIQRATPFEQAFYKKNEMVFQADALIKELQSFANDVNMIQMGQYDPNKVVEEEPAKMDVDGDGDIDAQDAAMQEQTAPEAQPVVTDILSLKDYNREDLKTILKNLIKTGQMSPEQMKEFAAAFRAVSPRAPKREYNFGQ